MSKSASENKSGQRENEQIGLHAIPKQNDDMAWHKTISLLYRNHSLHYIHYTDTFKYLFNFFSSSGDVTNRNRRNRFDFFDFVYAVNCLHYVYTTNESLDVTAKMKR